jgi:histidine ammonia-lyase
MSDRIVLLDGETLTPDQIVEIGENPSITVDLTDVAWKAVTRARAVVDRVLQRREVCCNVLNPISYSAAGFLMII